MPTKSDSSTPAVRSIGTTVVDAFKVGGMPLATVVCGALAIGLSQALAEYSWLCLAIGLLLVLVGVGVAVWDQARQFGPFIDFTKKLQGCWWERITPDASAAISFLRINPNVTTGTLRLRGRVFDRDGRHIADWDSVDSCVNPTTEKLFYYWTGQGRKGESRAQNGYGEFDFEFPAEGKPTAHGRYSDTTLGQDGKLVTKLTELRQASPDDEKVIFGDDPAATTALIQTRIRQFD
jgi:hypothetical protein